MNLLIGHAAASFSEHRHNSARSSGDTELFAVTNEMIDPRPGHVEFVLSAAKVQEVLMQAAR
jgi:hypothetical protein|tara:strand:+ start:6637 stop:6822 length:186 start_codon:yes stop_codon:yes gene_type:complete